MKYYYSYSNRKYPTNINYDYHYSLKKDFLIFDNVKHTFDIHDYIVSLLNPCDRYEALKLITHPNYINSDYVIFIYSDNNYIPIKKILES
jgi:hypothetical protein